MVASSITLARVLAIAHGLAGLLLLVPLTLVFVPVGALGALWLVALWIWLWNPTPRAWRALRRTHYAGLVLAALSCAYGVFALRAAERSAAAGGGLLGGFGLIPLALGVMVGAFSAAALWLARREPPPTTSAPR